MTTSQGRYRGRRPAASCLLLTLLLWLWPALPAMARNFEVLDKAYELISEKYIEEPDYAGLANGALSGVADLVKSTGRQLAPTAFDSQSVPNDKRKALKFVDKALETVHDTTDIPYEKLEEAAIRAMVKALDPHSAFLSKTASNELQVGIKGVFGGVGLQISIKDKFLTVVSPIDDTPASQAGLKPSDRIIKIEGEATDGMILSDAVYRLRGEKGTRVRLSVLREGWDRPRDFELTRDIVTIKSLQSRMLDDGIGYVRISQFISTTASDLDTVLNGMGARDGRLKGLVLDLRNNPGGLLDSAAAVADRFIDAETICSIKGRTDNSLQKFTGKTMGTIPRLPIILLVNEGSASSSEIVAGAMQDLNKATVIGKRTFGKGTVQNIFPLPHDGQLQITTAQYYLPDGRTVQGGIIPNIEVGEQDDADIPLGLAEAVFKAAAKQQGIITNDKLKTIARELAQSDNFVPNVLLAGGSAPSSALAILRPVRSDIDEIPAVKAKSNNKFYAVVIGIEQYRQNLPKADFATQDAKLVADYLTKSLGYAEENVVTLTNDRAALGDFVKYFEKWLPNNVEPNSTVFVYFSGHGAPNTKTGDAYIVPYDGDPSFIDETGYSLNRMYGALGKLPAREIVVALDSCFSGAGGRSVLAEGARPLVMNLQSSTALPQNIVVMSASAGEQTSSTYKEKGHGLFTYFLLKGIKNEDVVKADGSLDIPTLYDYVKPQVASIARKKYNNEQTPQLIGQNKN